MAKRQLAKFWDYDTGDRLRRDADLALANSSRTLIARGLIDGATAVNKFGRNTNVANNTVADIWDGGAVSGDSLIWVAPTTARLHDVASDSASDDGLSSPMGIGARTVQVYGLTDWDTAEVSEVVTLNGTTPVATVNAYVIIHRVEGLTWGTSGPNVGDITVTAQTDSTVTARVLANEGQTQMAIYGIPSTQKAYMYAWYSSINRSVTSAAGCNLELKFNPIPDQQTSGFLVKHTAGLNTAATSNDETVYDPPKCFEGPGILKVQASSGANGMDIDAGFNLVLYDN